MRKHPNGDDLSREEWGIIIDGMLTLAIKVLAIFALMMYILQ